MDKYGKKRRKMFTVLGNHIILKKKVEAKYNIFGIYTFD